MFNQFQPQGIMFNQQAAQQIQMTNPLGARAAEMLKNGNGQPKLQITQEAMDQAICTHRYNNALQLYDIGNGVQKCKICGAEFEPVDDVTQEQVEECTRNMHNLLHTAKLMWLDVPDGTSKEFFQIIAAVDQAPKIFAISKERFDKYTGNGNNMLIQNGGQYNAYNAYNALVSGAPMGMPMGMPMMAQPYMAQPMMAQGYVAQPTPMQAAMVQNAPGVVNNGFGFTTAPVAAGQQMIPPAPLDATQTQAQTQAAQTPAQASGAAVVTNTLTV